MAALDGLIVIGADGVTYRLIRFLDPATEALNAYPTLDKKSFGSSVKARREATGLSQHDFCALVPMTQSQLSLVETGESKPQKRTYLGIMRALVRLEIAPKAEHSI